MFDEPDLSRIALKPHLRAHVLTETEVALVGEFDRHALRGRAYAVLAPLLDGTRDADQIAAAVSDDLTPEVAYLALERLRVRGFTAEANGCDSVAWDAWWLAADQEPTDRATVLGDARVMISSIGVETGSVDSLCALVASSAAVIAKDATIEVCLIDDYLRPELAARVQTARDAGRAFLPVRPVGIQLWIGPLSGPNDWPDWNPFVQRLRGNRPVEAAVTATGADFPLCPAMATPQSVALALALSAKLIIRVAGGETPAVIDRAVWTFNTQTFESHRHELPLSMVNATGRVTSTDAARPIDLAASPKRFTADGGHRTCRPEQTLARLNRIVSPITGIVPAVVRLSDHPDMHVYGAIQTDDLPTFRTSAGNRLLGIPDRAMGKGETDVQARVSCLAEAVERYSSRYFPGRTKRRARLAELGGDAVHPDSVLQFSSRQYDSRSAWNARYGGSPNWVPEPFDDATPVDWTAAWSLSRRRTRWLPSAFCFFAYPFEGGPAFAQGDSNGCASGNTIEEAILQGLFELIERDACALWWYNRAKRPEIDLASFGQPFFERMQDRCHDLQRTLHVLDLRTEFDVPVALAVSWRRQDGSNIHFGIGCHLEPRLAVSRALAELNQMLLIEGRTNDPATRIAAQFSPGLIDWLENECVADHAYVVPNGMPSIVAQDMHDWSSNDVSDDIRYSVGKLADNGLETIVLDLTRPEIGFPVVRVVVPGLRHFWARLAPGRLYDSPVKLGWLASQTGEDEVNDIPFFM